MTKGKTISEAAHDWVREMNSYPQDMIQTLMEAHPDDWNEVTKPRRYDRVYILDMPERDINQDDNKSTSEYGEITEVTSTGEGDLYAVELDDGVIIEVTDEDIEVQRDGYLPMWGWLWSFGDSCDDWWMDEDDGIRKMSDAGFRIYEHEEWGYFFGIDGAGYDFYREHWIPAYRARGLKWHDPETEEK